MLLGRPPAKVGCTRNRPLLSKKQTNIKKFRIPVCWKTELQNCNAVVGSPGGTWRGGNSGQRVELLKKGHEIRLLCLERQSALAFGEKWVKMSPLCASAAGRREVRANPLQFAANVARFQRACIPYSASAAWGTVAASGTRPSLQGRPGAGLPPGARSRRRAGMD